MGTYGNYPNPQSHSIEEFGRLLKDLVWKSRIDRNEAERKKSKYHK